MSEPMRRYVYRTLDLGVVAGAIGDQSFPPEIMALIEGFHAVLAGGEAEVRVVDHGNELVRRELDQTLSDACNASNRLAMERGVYVTATG